MLSSCALLRSERSESRKMKNGYEMFSWILWNCWLFEQKCLSHFCHQFPNFDLSYFLLSIGKVATIIHLIFQDGGVHPTQLRVEQLRIEQPFEYSCALNSCALNNHWSRAAHWTACNAVATCLTFWHLKGIQFWHSSLSLSHCLEKCCWLRSDCMQPSQILIIMLNIATNQGIPVGLEFWFFMIIFFHMIELKVSYLNCVSLAP